MAPIPEFQRQRFASSVVGTPGEDRSGQIIGQSVTRAAGQIEDVAFQVAAKRQRAMDESLAVRTQTDFSMKAQALAAQADVDYAEFDGSPEDRASQMRTKYEELFKETANTIKSPNARSMFERAGQEMVGNMTLNEAKRGRSNQATLAAKNTLETVNLLGIQAAELGQNRGITDTQRFMALQGLLQQGEAAYQAGFEAYSVEDRQRLLEDIPASISKSMLSNMVADAPESVASFIDSGQFDDVLSADERKKYKDDALSAIPKMKERQAQLQLQADIQGNLDLWKAVVNKEPGAMRMVEESNLKSASTMKDIILKSEPAVVDDWSTTIELAGMIDSLFDHDKKTGKPTKLSKKTQLEDLQRVMDFGLQAVADRKLTHGTTDTYLDNLFVPYYNAVKAENSPPDTLGKTIANAVGGAANVVASPWVSPARWLLMSGAEKFWSKQNNASDESRGRVITEMMTRFTPQNVKSEADATAVVQGAIKNEAMRLSPGLATTEGTPGKIQRPDRQQISISGGRGTVKNAIPIKGNQNYTKRMKGAESGKVYDVTFSAQGKELSRKEVTGG